MEEDQRAREEERAAQDRERAAREADLESRLKAEQDARVALEKRLRLDFEAFVRKFTTPPS